MNIINILVAVLSLMSLLGGLLIFSYKLFRRIDILLELPPKVDRMSLAIEKHSRQINFIERSIQGRVVNHERAEPDETVS